MPYRVEALLIAAMGNRALGCFFVLFAILFLPSCGGGSYEGYQTLSYTVRGQRYHPMSVEQALRHEERGTASWYDESKWFGFVRGTTSLQEKVGRFDMIAAHKTLPLPARIKVTNLENGRSVKLRVNDRGPFIGNRILDVSPRAARKLGFKDQGLTEVRIKVLSVGDGSYKRKARKRFLFF